MHITLCGSLSVYADIKRAGEELERLGHTVHMPPERRDDGHGGTMGVQERYEASKRAHADDVRVWDMREMAMREYFDHIAKSDAVLAVNVEKNGIAGYIGVNTLMELGVAFHHKKRVYLLHDIPDVPYKEEILGLRPVALSGDLSRLVPKRPGVGVGVLIFRDGKVLFGKRKNAHGSGSWAGPGGHLEEGESFEACIRREAMEEAGVEIENIRFLCTSNVLRYGKHYVDIGLIADWKAGEPRVREQEKCEGWQWFDPNHLTVPLFYVVENYLVALKTGRSYFDSAAMRYDKLVRDTIPQIIQMDGGRPVVHRADDAEYTKRLRDKLQEEVEEFIQSDATEELADVLEVIEAVATHRGLNRAELEALRLSKRAARGGFDGRTVLDEVL